MTTMDQMSYSYWTCTNPNTKREMLPNGIFAVWSERGDQKVIVHVKEGLVQRIEYWKITRFDYWSKGQSDRVRV